MTTITERFINGLKIYNLTSEEIKEWKYCGGNTGKELNRFKEFFKNKELPIYSNKCVCGHTIKKNCYITNRNIILIVGSCCVKRFMKNGLKKECLTCESVYKGKYRCCKECRKTRCWSCCSDSKNKYCNKCLKIL